jgi:hypothetical protein
LPNHLLPGAGDFAPATHHSSHASLLQPYRRGGRLRLNAIVVSASRTADNLRPALRLGAALDVPVVLLCSHATRIDQAEAEAATVRGVSCVAVDVSSASGKTHLPSFQTSNFRQAQVGSAGDLSLKRNLGLILGRLAGWKALLFLDDDIVDLKPVQVKRAAAALDYFAAVGMPARDFPDNSVVCHANRLSGSQQDVFVSASALTVNVEITDAFFPDMYSEDWLFLAPYLDRSSVARYGVVRQKPYEPFEYPYRAGTQEFGDILAEGLIGFLHSARLYRPPSIYYWESFLESRAAFLSFAMEACRNAPTPDNGVARAALAALEIAEHARSSISAAALADYIEAWLHDLVTWRRFLGALSRTTGLLAAVHNLDLPVVTVTSRRSLSFKQVVIGPIRQRTSSYSRSTR